MIPNMKRAIFALVAFGCTSLLSAYDYGLVLSSDSNVSSEASQNLTQRERARAWFNVLVGDGSGLYLSGFYEFSGTFEKSGATLVPARFDLDRTEFEGSLAGILGPKSVLKYSLGRAYFMDFSSRILAGLSDGARLELAIANLTFQLTGGYRGLLYKSDARSYIDADDQAINDSADPAVYFAPKRAFGGLGARYTELFTGHDVGMEVWGQLDLETSGVPTNTVYVEPYIEGRFGRPIRWRAFGIYEQGYDIASFKAGAAGSMLRLSLPDLAGFRLTQSIIWASGSGGGLAPFTPLRQGSLGSVIPLPLSDALSASLEAAASPLGGSYVSLSAATLFRMSKPDGADPTMRSDASSSYLGFEGNLQLSIYPTSDLSLSASFGAFLPNTSTMYISSKPNRLTASFSATLNL